PETTGRPTVYSMRLRTKLGVVIGLLTACMIVLAVVEVVLMRSIQLQLRHIVDVTAQKRLFALQFPLALREAIRAEKNALGARNEADAAGVVRKGEGYTAEANKSRQALAEALEGDATLEERTTFQDINRNWDDFQRTQKQVLQLAVQKTNTKAQSLLDGKLNEKASAALAAVEKTQKQTDAEFTAAADAKNAE